MRVVAFFAHPDDETMLIGGTLALAARLGMEVVYVCATRGEGGELGDPPVCDREQVADTRTGELACAVRALGGSELRFLGYIDPLVGPGDELYAFSNDIDDVVARLELQLSHFRPDVLVTHGSRGEYGHPAHVLIYQAVKRWMAEQGPDAPLWYTVRAAFEGDPRPWSSNADDRADLVIDITATLEQKTQAALCHRSQHALFVRKRSEELGRTLTVPECITAVESLHRAYPPGDELLLDPFAEALIRSGHVQTGTAG
jgi:LmbE family N-acetylglucosaminyl deacetylase